MKKQKSLTVLGWMVMTKFAKKFVTELSQLVYHWDLLITFIYFLRKHCEFEMITDIRHFWNHLCGHGLHCKKCHPVLYIDIIKCLFIDDWVSFVDSLHIEMEALDCKAVVDT